MADLQLARTFVDAHGDPVQSARIAAALGDQTRLADFPTLNDAGAVAASWAPAGSADLSSVALAYCAELGLTDAAGRLRQWLLSVQRADGSFRDVPEQADPGPEVPSRDVNVQGIPVSVDVISSTGADQIEWGATTAWAAYALSVSGTDLEPLTAAADYLLSQHAWRDLRAANWFAIAILDRCGRTADADPLADDLGAQIDEMVPAELASLAATIPHRSCAGGARFRLQWRQEEDGRWESGIDPERDISTTVDAVRALLLDPAH